MTTTEKLYQLIQTLPEDQINQIFYFAEALHQKQHNLPQAIPLGTLTGLLGIAKRADSTPSDQEVQGEYTDRRFKLEMQRVLMKQRILRMGYDSQEIFSVCDL